MDNLYRRETLPSGRRRYVETCEWDTGHPADGLWIVRRSGQSKTWINDLVCPTPERAPDLTWVASKLDEIADVISENWWKGTPYERARLILARLMEESTNDADS